MNDHEMKEAIFNLNPNSAPSLEGFGGIFYNSSWDIIGLDVCRVVHQFFLCRIGFFLG